MSPGKADRGAPSNADLVHEVLRSAERPLTFPEIFARVNERRPVATRNPRATIRNALTQGAQLISLGDGRYGYLPHLLQGSLVRLPLTEKKPANHPLVYPDEVRQALWPSFFDIQKRRLERPARLRLPTGDEVALPLDFLGTSSWGGAMPEGLRRYLVDERAAAGDSLLIRVVDGEAGACEAWFESRLQRDKDAVSRRNRELADAAHEILRGSRSIDVPIWEVIVALLVRGVYRADVAPDSLEDILGADSRFVAAGLSGWILAERVTPLERAAIRDRQQLETELFRSMGASAHSSAPAPPSRALPFSMERTLADLGALVAEQGFSSAEELDAFLQGLPALGPPHRTATTPLEQAQEVIYDAWEAPSARQRVRLARKALERSPDCADAYVLLAEEMAQTPGEAADLYAKGVAAGERALGETAFQEAVGHFWGILETRPYMRAQLGLADALWALDRREEAIAHLWDMLRLNPGDNQGVRYVLATWLLEVADDTGLGRLFEQYPDDISATWPYTRALARFRRAGADRQANAALKDAFKANPFVPLYLLGARPLPKDLPAYLGIGDEDEAVGPTSRRQRQRGSARPAPRNGWRTSSADRLRRPGCRPDQGRGGSQRRIASGLA